MKYDYNDYYIKGRDHQNRQVSGNLRVHKNNIRRTKKRGKKTKLTKSQVLAGIIAVTSITGTIKIGQMAISGVKSVHQNITETMQEVDNGIKNIKAEREAEKLALKNVAFTNLDYADLKAMDMDQLLRLYEDYFEYVHTDIAKNDIYLYDETVDKKLSDIPYMFEELNMMKGTLTESEIMARKEQILDVYKYCENYLFDQTNGRYKLISDDEEDNIIHYVKNNTETQGLGR